MKMQSAMGHQIVVGRDTATSLAFHTHAIRHRVQPWTSAVHSRNLRRDLESEVLVSLETQTLATLVVPVCVVLVVAAAAAVVAVMVVSFGCLNVFLRFGS